MNDKKNLLLFFDRPREPIFMAKGKKGTVFDVPDNYLTDRYRPLGVNLQSRFGENAGETVPVRNISLPDLSVPMSLGRHEHFSLFIPKHREISSRLIAIFMGNYLKIFRCNSFYLFFFSYKRNAKRSRFNELLCICT